MANIYVEYSILFLISVIAIFLIYNSLLPAIEKIIQSSNLENAINEMNYLARAIEEVSKEAVGSYRKITLNIKDGTLYVDNASNSLVYTYKVYSDIISKSLYQTFDKVKLTYGETKVYEDDNSVYLENDFLLVNISKKIYNTSTSISIPIEITSKLTGEKSFLNYSINNISINWLSGWQYRIPITINNTLNSNNLIDYQVLVTLNVADLISQGKMRSDFGDIRFTDSDGTTLLNYWIEPLSGILYLGYDDGIRCYINDQLVVDALSEVHGVGWWNKIVDVSYALKYGENLLACWVANGGENSGTGVGGLDLRLVVNGQDIIPQSDDDSSTSTKDSNCFANPTFKYYYCSHPCEPLGWNKTTFNDSSWNVGNAPFAPSSSWGCTNALTTAPDDLFIRKKFYINYSRIWVKVPFIQANSYKTIYVYYGNPSANSLSNATATMKWFDDFNRGNLGCGTLYNCGGTLPWVIASDRVYEGIYSAGSDPNIDDNQDSWMEKTLTFNTGFAISFYDSVSSEANYDFLQFLIDGVEKHKISGEVGWTLRTYTGGPGTHTFRWRYYKDVIGTAGADRGWIDYLIIREYTSPEPTVTLGNEEMAKQLIHYNTISFPFISKIEYSFNFITNTTRELSFALLPYADFLIAEIDYLKNEFIRIDTSFSSKYSLKPISSKNAICLEKQPNNIFFISSKNLNFKNWLLGWQYRIPITINNTLNSNNLTDYQVLVTLNTSSLISQGKMKNDCGDIRFTDSDGTTLLNYWIESGCNTTSTRIWVKIPNIPASGTKTIYMYYGNPNANSLSNGDLVFDFFDDFLGTSLNTSKWTGGYASFTSASYSVSNGILSIWSSSSGTWQALHSNYVVKVTDKVIAEQKVYIEGTDQSQHYFYFVSNDNADTQRFGIQEDGTTTSGNNVRVQYLVSGTFYHSGSLYNVGNNWHIARIIKSDSYTFTAQILDLNYTQLGTTFTTTQTAWTKDWWVPNYWTQTSYKINVDWIRVRKYTSPEPTITLKNEETISSINFTSVIIETFSNNVIISQTIGTCKDVENKIYQMEEYQIPITPLGNINIENLPKKITARLEYSNPKIILSSSEEFPKGSYEIYIMKIGEQDKKSIIYIGTKRPSS